jgi:hypothetical protein
VRRQRQTGFRAFRIGQDDVLVLLVDDTEVIIENVRDAIADVGAGFGDGRRNSHAYASRQRGRRNASLLRD